MRGVNGPIHPARRAAACVAAFAALAPLIALRFAGWAHDGVTGGAGATGRTQYEYEIAGAAAWAGPVATVLAVLIAIAAAGLWAARDRRVLALVAAAGLCGAAGTVAATAYANSAGISTHADFAALPLGSTRADVHARLGAAPGNGSATRGGTTLDCDVYWSLAEGGRYFYCYDGDALALKLR
jgi:hypothetical protein